MDGGFSISRSDSPSYALQVNFTVGGSAVNGVDYESIPSSVVIPQKAQTVGITIRPIPSGQAGGNETVILTLQPSDTLHS